MTCTVSGQGGVAGPGLAAVGSRGQFLGPQGLRYGHKKCKVVRGQSSLLHVDRVPSYLSAVMTRLLNLLGQGETKIVSKLMTSRYQGEPAAKTPEPVLVVTVSVRHQPGHELPSIAVPSAIPPVDCFLRAPAPAETWHEGFHCRC